jgi:CHASE2 domain-containing sensor protein
MLRVLLSLPVRLGSIVLLGIVFIFLCFQFQWFTPIDLTVYDLGLNVRTRTDYQSEVVVIAIDRNSRENALPQPHFPISRHTNQHSQVIRRLTDAGAKLIAFDILFDQLDPELDFTPFVSAIEDAGNVVFAGVIESQILKASGTSASIQEERLLLPSVAIRTPTLKVGLVNMPLGPDQVARECYYGTEFQGRWYPSLPAAMVSGFLGMEASELAVAERFYIDYSSPEQGFQTIPYADILGKEDWRDRVRGRIALVGVVENGLSDTHNSPVPDLPGTTQRHKLPGVLFLAYSANTLLRDSAITTLPASLSVLLALILVVGCAFLALGKRLGVVLALVGIVTLVLLVCGIFLVAANVTIAPAGKLIAVWLVTGAVGTLVSFSYTRFKSSQQETQLEEISSDLKMAKQIQQKLQPEKIPEMEGAEISGLQIPCKEIGGDYYDVITLSDAKVALLVADVSGKGISGALVMSNFQSVVHSLAPKILSPGPLLAELNTAVSKIVTPGRFVTFFYGILDLDSKKFAYGNAGHNYPMLCRAGGEVREFEEGGLFLGPFPQGTWESYEIGLESGDVLFLYTDGVTEAAKKTDEQFGEERLKQYLRENRAQRARQINERLVGTLTSFTGSGQFEDDVTLLTLKIL